MEDPSLLALIRKYFNEDELRIVCFQIGVDYEDLPALGKTAKISELIRFCHRNGRFPALLKTLAQERPRATWPNPDDPHTLDFLLGQAAAPLLPYEPETVPVTANNSSNSEIVRLVNAKITFGLSFNMS